MAGEIQNNQIQKIAHLQEQYQNRFPDQSVQSKGTSFDELLRNHKFKLSGHAQTRLQSREIQLNEKEWNKVFSAIDEAAKKGAKESLVLLKRDNQQDSDQEDIALIVSVKNRTVITAVKDLQENVFTNIDSAVIVKS
jgi:flagellar operon protein